MGIIFDFFKWSLNYFGRCARILPSCARIQAYIGLSCALFLVECSGEFPEIVESSMPNDDALESLLQQRIERNRVGGIVLGIRDSDGSHRVVAFGDPGPGATPLGPKSVFNIASVTKTFSGALLADMMARGEVKLDDPVQMHVRQGVHIPSRGDRKITLLDLATHTSGLPRMPDNLSPAENDNPVAHYSEDQLYAFISSYTLSRDIGSRFKYSNIGVGLLAQVLAEVSGLSWESLAEARLFEPLGMTMTGLALRPEMLEHLARGHDEAGQVTSNWDIPVPLAGGALRSTVDDMLLFLDANLDKPSIVVEATLKYSHSPRFEVDAQRSIGLCWQIRKTKNTDIVWHSGATNGYSSFLGFDPKRQIGVVLLSNSMVSVDDLGFHLLDPSLELRRLPSEREEVSIPEDILKEYIGKYETPSEWKYKITLVDGQLYVQVRDPTEEQSHPRFPLFAESKSHFFLRVADVQISFVRSEAGEVVALRALEEGWIEQRAKKQKATIPTSPIRI